jgi:hypothetical protein
MPTTTPRTKGRRVRKRTDNLFRKRRFERNFFQTRLRQLKASGTPRGAYSYRPHHRRIVHANARKLLLMRRAPCRGALACRRSTTALAAATERPSSAPDTRFLGNFSVRRRLGVIRCYLHLRLSQSSECPRRPVVMPAGRMSPEPPGSEGDEPPPAGTALAPPAGVTGWRPFKGARFFKV